MKNTIIIYLLLLPLSVLAQTDTATVQKSDSIISEKGNLNLLVDRIFLAFKAYQQGIYKFNDPHSAHAVAHRDSLQKAGWIVNFSADERPIRPAIMKNGKLMPIIEDLSTIPVDSVQSIEVMVRDAVSLAKYGLGGVNGVIIRLKDD